MLNTSWRKIPTKDNRSVRKSYKLAVNHSTTSSCQKTEENSTFLPQRWPALNSSKIIALFHDFVCVLLPPIRCGFSGKLFSKAIEYQLQHAYILFNRVRCVPTAGISNLCLAKFWPLVRLCSEADLPYSPVVLWSKGPRICAVLCFYPRDYSQKIVVTLKHPSHTKTSNSSLDSKLSCGFINQVWLPINKVHNNFWDYQHKKDKQHDGDTRDYYSGGQSKQKTCRECLRYVSRYFSGDRL